MMSKAQKHYHLAAVRVVALLSLPPLHVTHTPHEENMMTPSLSDALDTIDAKNKRIAELEAMLGAAVISAADNPIADAHAHVKQAIAELKAADVTVPIALYKAAHALRFKKTESKSSLPAVSRASHFS